MKKIKLYTLFVFLSLIIKVHGQSVMEVSGTYYGNVTWEADTVKIVGDILIEKDDCPSKFIVAIAQRYLPEDLEPYEGLAITQVEFIAGGPDNLIFNQQIRLFKADNKNRVYLETPVIIDADEVLWVVVNCCQTAAGHVFGMSDVVVDMKGNFQRPSS